MISLTADENTPPTEGDVAGGLSDGLILSISFTGFALVALTLYIFVLRQSTASEDDDAEGKPARTYEEELDDADVRTLNRAQLRARAKHRMKKARRIAREAAAEGDAGEGQGQDGEQAAIVVAEANIEGEVGEEYSLQSSPVQHLSRKERNKAAKVAEREERRKYAEMRREQNQAAEKERREKEKEEKAAEDDARQRANVEKKERERAEYEKWKYAFEPEERMIENDNDPPPVAVAVADFIEHIRRLKVAKIKDLAGHYQVESRLVEERLRQLQEEGRITGIIDDTGHFVHITRDDMMLLHDMICQKGKIRLSDFAMEVAKLV